MDFNSVLKSCMSLKGLKVEMSERRSRLVNRKSAQNLLSCKCHNDTVALLDKPVAIKVTYDER